MSPRQAQRRARRDAPAEDGSSQSNCPSCRRLAPAPIICFCKVALITSASHDSRNARRLLSSPLRACDTRSWTTLISLLPFMPKMRLPILVVVLVAALTACHRPGAPATPPANSAGPALPSGVTQAMIAQGDSIFHSPAASCGRCHGSNGEGATNAPSLRTGPWLQTDGSFEKIVAVIVTGVPRAQIKVATRPFAMNPRGGPMNLSDEQASSVAAYIWSISREKTAAARTQQLP
jgi:mono/diheme cytochrome c family protein